MEEGNSAAELNPVHPHWLTVPSYKVVKFCSFLQVFPVSINSLGKFHKKTSSVSFIIHRIILCLPILKIMHLLYVLTGKFANSVAEDVATVILLILILSMLAVAAFWNFEVFVNHLSEAIILFNEIDPTLLFRSMTLSERVEKSDRVFEYTKHQFKRKKNNNKNIVNLLHELLRISKVTLPELMLVLTPFGINIFAPLYLTMNLLFPNWSCFTSAMLPAEALRDSWSDWRFTSIMAFETCVAFFVQFSIFFLFFFELALQCSYFFRLQELLEEVE